MTDIQVRPTADRPPGVMAPRSRRYWITKADEARRRAIIECDQADDVLADAVDAGVSLRLLAAAVDMTHEGVRKAVARAHRRRAADARTTEAVT